MHVTCIEILARKKYCENDSKPVINLTKAALKYDEKYDETTFCLKQKYQND